MLGTVHVYYIWYGAWNGNSAVSLLQLLAGNIGGSSYFNINTTYYNANQAHVSGAVTFAGATNDNYSQGKSLSDAQIQQVVVSAISSGKLPADSNGVYFVLTSADVTATSGFCSQYCGWHTATTTANTTIKYAFVGDASKQCPYNCAAQTTSPNGNAGADGMASVIAHELEETVTDPTFGGWYDASGNENGDKCAWSFGSTYKASNGSYANMKIGGTDFLIQQNWVNSNGGYCALQFGGAVLSSVSPTSGAAGTTVPITLTGTGFAAGSTLTISGTGVTASSVTVVSATQITATLALSGAAGAYTIAVASSAATTNPVTFTVNPGPPTLTAISPNSGAPGATVPVTLTGTNFVKGATVAVSGTGVTASAVTLVNATQLTATFTLAAGSTGAHNVTVTTPSGTTATVPFTVNPPAPTLTSVSPSTGLSGATVPVTLTGTNFATGATVGVTGTGVTVSNLKVVSATQITASLALTGAASAHSLSVTTAGGTSNTEPFTVNASTPALTSVSPASAPVGSSVNVTLTGSNLTSGSTLNISGSGVSSTNVTVVNSTTITARLTVNGSAGAHTLSVASSAGTTNGVTFTATDTTPTLTAIDPPAGVIGSTVNVALTGTNFAAGSNLTISGTGITAKNVTVVSATKITAQLTVGGTAVTHTIAVTGSNGTSNTVNFGATLGLPTVTAISPNSAATGTTANVTLTGSNFVSGSTLQISGTGVTASKVTVVSATSITAQLTVGGAVGDHTIVVAGPTTSSISNPVTFSVTAGAPTLTSVSPATAAVGSQVNVTFTGTNFAAGSGVILSGNTMLAGDIKVVNSNTITAVLLVTGTPGVHTLAITGPNGNSNTVNFTATAGASNTPTLTAITPTGGAAGTTVPVTLTGTNFVTGTAVGADTQTFAFSNIKVVNATTITASLTIATSNATGSSGAHKVAVMTPGGTSAPVTFTVK
jgi:hypothetical protein